MSNDYRTVLDYLNTTPECDAFYDAVNALDRMHATPVNPGATQALVTALRAIVDAHDAVDAASDPECWSGPYPNPEQHAAIMASQKEMDTALNKARNAMHMAQLLVVPVSEDVETIREAIKQAAMKIPRWEKENTLLCGSLAALDRLAAAAGRQHADICGLCGNQGADKTPQMSYWPGERIPNKGRLVHKKCEDEERNRAFDALTPDEIADSFPS